MTAWANSRIRASPRWARWVVIAFLYGGTRAQAQQPLPRELPVAVAVAEAKEVLLGAHFEIFVTVTFPEGDSVMLASPLPLPQGIEEVSRGSESLIGDGETTRTYRLVLQSFALGVLRIPPLAVQYLPAGEPADNAASSVTIYTNAVALAVVGVIAEGEDGVPRGLDPPVPAYTTHWSLVYAVGAGVVLILALPAFWLVRRAWRRRVRSVSVGASDTGAAPSRASEQALGRLRELEQSGAIEAADRKPVFLTLSEIVRDYLGTCLQFPALDSTTAEIIEFLRLQGELGTQIASRLGGWLEVCDVVKFANEPASADDARDALEQARRFIEEVRLDEFELLSVRQDDPADEEGRRA